MYNKCKVIKEQVVTLDLLLTISALLLVYSNESS